jgi:hypothetical protein
MLQFLATDPFPLVADSGHTYAEAQLHSAEVDAWLGIEVDQAEADFSAESREIDASQNLWRDLPAKMLLTPYTELRWILSLLRPKPGELVIDLGAAYGRMGFVVARHFPEVRFIGYELAEPRVAAGRRAMMNHHLPPTIQLERADLSSPAFRPETAESYFLYDYGSRRAIQKTLDDLRAISLTRKIRVVGRGRAVRDAIERECPWLSQVQEPEHYSHFSIYSS